MNSTEDLYYFGDEAGDSKYNVSMRCFESIIGELRSCDGTNKTENFPSFEKILKWREFSKSLLDFP